MGAVTARAAVIKGFGAPDVLVPGTVEVPDPGPSQVRVAVRYAGVGPTDLDIRAGHLAAVFPSPPGTALGFEVAGVVDAIGPDVLDVSVGDDVAAFLPGLGGYASLCLADHWVPKPPHVDPAEAAALPASGEAAVRVLSQLGVAPGETLLVLGGTGSVGLLAVQLAVRRGARVAAAVREDDRERVAELGAIPVAYDAQLVDEVHRSVGHHVDAIFDAATGSDLRAALELTDDPARVITLSNHDAPSLGVRLSGPDPDHADTALAEAMSALAQGHLRLRARTVLPLTHAAEAHARLEQGERTKFVLEV